MKYNPAEIEPKWQRYWEENQTFKAPEMPSARKKYVLDMFPYPSANGLHVGHPEGYTATDIVCRFYRMDGVSVLHPMGWDAFGLPAEQQAKKTGIHPRTITENNIGNFRRQLKMLGFSYDWSREVATTDVNYFKWTQHIFLLMFNTWYDPDTKKGRPISELPIPQDVVQQGLNAVETYKDEHRLAYQIEAPVNWCSALGTVLANEEVIGGRSERGNHPVVRMPLRQWMLRITAYADRLESDLEGLDWAEGIKLLQRNWIGRSTGAEVDFFIGSSANLSVKGPKSWRKSVQTEFEDWKEQRKKNGFPRKPDNNVLRIYTTRPDTLFGATYMVIAPEHPFVERLTTAEQKEAVEAYQQQAASKSDLDRTDLAKDKTGVFTGSYALNPVNGEPIPIWVADYVLISYGTGAIMSVPAHDTRDFEFAKQFNLPVIQVVQKISGERQGVDFEPFTEQGVAVNSGGYDGLITPQCKEKITNDLTAAGLGRKAVNYKLRDWLFSRQHFWGEPFPLLHELEPPNTSMEEVEIRLRQKCEQLAVPLIRIPFSPESFGKLFGEEHAVETPIGRVKIGENQFEKLQSKDRQELLGAMKQTLTEPIVIIKEMREEGLSNLFIKSFRNEDGESFYFVMSVVINREGVMVSVLTHRRKNKQIFQKIENASPADIVWEVPMPTGQGQHGYSVNSPSSPQNSQGNDTTRGSLSSKNGESQEGDDYSKWKPTGRVVPLDASELPLDMPRELKFDAEHNSPEPPLEHASADWLYVERNGKKYKRETNTMPQWAGSCWYYLRFIDPHNNNAIVDPEKEKHWMPVDLYVGGAEHAVLHLLYARFWHKVLYDYGLVSTKEPFQKLVNQGMILGEDGQKMSKSRGNVINPDDVVKQYGADSLRLYEMFMGPLESVKPWSMDSVSGVRNFLDRVWRMIVETKEESLAATPQACVLDIEPTPEQNRVLHKTIKAVGSDIRNMSFNTAIARMMEFVNFFSKEKIRPKSAMEKFVLILSPFAPHIAEELWQILNHHQSLAFERFPSYDEAALVEQSVEIPVSVNGKLRSKITAAPDANEATLEAAALADAKIAEQLNGKTLVKKIIVKGKMVNFVVK